MKIITYNVNGLRAAVSKGLPEWLAQENPDILCLQETKLQPDQYPGEDTVEWPYLPSRNRTMWNMGWEWRLMIMKDVLSGRISETYR